MPFPYVVYHKFGDGNAVSLRRLSQIRTRQCRFPTSFITNSDTAMPFPYVVHNKFGHGNAVSLRRS